MSADIPLESPAQAIRQGEGGQTHDGHEDDDGAQERRLGYAQRVEQPSGGAGQEEVRAAQTHHDGLIDEVARDGEVDAEGARPEQADRDHELADEQGHRADEKVLPIQDVEEQGLAEQIEPDHEYSAQPEGQVLETPPHRPARVSQRRLEAIEHRDGGEELDDDANLTRQAELAIAEWARGVQHEDEGREDIDAGRDGEPDASQRKGHAPAVGNRRIGVAGRQKGEQAPGDRRQEAGGFQRSHPPGMGLGRRGMLQQRVHHRGFEGKGDHARGKRGMAQPARGPEQRDSSKGQAEDNRDERGGVDHAFTPTIQ